MDEEFRGLSAHRGAAPVACWELLDGLLDALVVLEPSKDGLIVVLANTAACEAAGVPRAEIVGRRLQDVSVFQIDERIEAEMLEVLAAGNLWEKRGLAAVQRSTGQRRFVDLRIQPLRGHLSVAWHDVTARHQAVEALEESERRYRLLAQNATDVVYTVDNTGTITWVSPSVVDRLGWQPDQIVGHPVHELMNPDDLGGLTVGGAVDDSGRAGGSTELRVLAADGEWRWMSLTGRVLHDDDGTIIGGVEALRDITMRKTTELRLEHAASHDPLTGLANRVRLIDEISRSLSASKRSGLATAVILIDLDNFKVVNDSLGHAVGDDLLRQAGARLGTLVRDTDVVARQGGDEFAVVMRGVAQAQDAMRTAWRIVESFRAPLEVGDYELVTTASLGVALSHGDTSADSLMVDADRALYVAKEEGRDRASLFNQAIRDEVSTRLADENDLRHALHRGELELWFHPIVRLSPDGTRSMPSVEALVRWNHKGARPRPAIEFIDIAEETGLIIDIGDWVIAEACAEAVRWASIARPSPVVTVNLSTRQLLDPELVDMVADALADTGCPPELLAFEFAETPALRAHSMITDNLAGLNALGVGLGIDGFGSSHASIVDLHDLPVTSVKIDHRLVRSSVDDERFRALTSGVIDLAQRLGLTVIAGGVERVEEATLLEVLGCLDHQGFLYWPVMPAAEVSRMLTDIAQR